MDAAALTSRRGQHGCAGWRSVAASLPPDLGSCKAQGGFGRRSRAPGPPRLRELKAPPHPGSPGCAPPMAPGALLRVTWASHARRCLGMPCARHSLRFAQLRRSVHQLADAGREEGAR
ncbi:unnamed protein product [Urochloa humidicola]